MTPIVFKWTDFAIADGLRLGAILVIALVLNRVLRALTRRLIPAAGAEGLGRIARMREQHVKTLSGLLYSAGTAIIAVGAILTALPVFGFNVTPIAAVAGLASLAFGFGAQHLVRDLINGFFIIIEDQFIVGETVQIGTVTGRVEHLTLRRTVIRDVQGAVVSIPNGAVSQVANLSRDWGQVFVDISIPPESSADTALAALEHVCAELRADASWSPVLVDGPRALGVDSLERPELTCGCSFAPSRAARTMPRGNCAGGFKTASSRNTFAGVACSAWRSWGTNLRSFAARSNSLGAAELWSFQFRPLRGEFQRMLTRFLVFRRSCHDRAVTSLFLCPV